jgi:hypothetical protein
MHARTQAVTELVNEMVDRGIKFDGLTYTTLLAMADEEGEFQFFFKCVACINTS